MLFLTDGLENLGEKELEFLLPYLSDQRKEKVLSYRFLPDKISSAAAFVLLRYALKEYTGEDVLCEFGFYPEGKPYLLSRADVRFSLSHDKKGVCVALSESEIGADVQEVFPYEKSLAERILSPRERSVFDRFGPDDRLFTRMWTMKESLGKRTGKGVYDVMEKTDFSEPFSDSKIFGDHAYTTGEKGNLCFSVCSDKKEDVRFVERERLFDSVLSLKKYSDLI